jgi:membrane protein DedA with SNARE-associated domain
VLLGYYAGRQSSHVLHWTGGVAVVLIAGFLVYTRLTRRKRTKRTAHSLG